MHETTDRGKSASRPGTQMFRVASPDDDSSIFHAGLGMGLTTQNDEISVELRPDM